MTYILGFDIGGTKIEAALLDFTNHGSPVATQSGLATQYSFHLNTQPRGSFRIAQRMRHATERHQGYEHILSVLDQLGRSCLDASSLRLSDVHAIGFGLPGAIDPSTNQMIMGNTAVLKHRDIGKDLLRLWKSDLKYICENDANCFAFAEAVAGQGLGLLDSAISPGVLGVILGTGVGGGFVWHGQTLRGHMGGGCEIGHFVLHAGGRTCYCGQKGCAEQYLSGPGFIASYGGRFSALGITYNPQDVIQRAHNGDPLAIAVINEYRADLRTFFVQLANIFDPHLIVLGGGLSQQPELFQNLETELRDLVFNKIPPSILSNKLGDSAGVLGAALLAYQIL